MGTLIVDPTRLAALSGTFLRTSTGVDPQAVAMTCAAGVAALGALDSAVALQEFARHWVGVLSAANQRWADLATGVRAAAGTYRQLEAALARPGP